MFFEIFQGNTRVFQGTVCVFHGLLLQDTARVPAGYIHVLLLALIHSLVGVRYCSSWNVVGYVFTQVSGTVLSCKFSLLMSSWLSTRECIYWKTCHLTQRNSHLCPTRSPDVNLPPTVDGDKNGDHEPQNNAVEDTSTVQNVSFYIDVCL